MVVLMDCKSDGTGSDLRYEARSPTEMVHMQPNASYRAPCRFRAPTLIAQILLAIGKL